MFRNTGLVLRSAVLSLALASVFACAADDTGKEDQGSTGSDLSKGNKHPKADASTNDDDGGITTWSDGGFVYDASAEDAGADDSDGGTVNDASGRW